jgi:hypothetical protein
MVSFIGHPCAWQGWVCQAAFVCLLIADFIRLDQRSHSVSDTLRPWIIDTLILVVLLVLAVRIMSKKPEAEDAESDSPGL